MSSDLRVPPGVTLTFERLAVAICEDAKLDYEQWAPQIHEIVTHLQERWREGIEQGLSTDAAEARTLQLFGSIDDVARALRPSWIGRFLTFERYRGQRYAFFLCGAVLCAYVEAAKAIIGNEAKYATGSVGFFYLLGSSLNGAVALGALTLVKWRPNVRSTALRMLLACRWVVAPFMLTGLINVLFVGAVIFPLELIRTISKPARIPMLLMVGLAAVMGAAGAAGYLAELFDVPQRRSKRLKSALLAAQAR